jgi:hypothetical protein
MYSFGLDFNKKREVPVPLRDDSVLASFDASAFQLCALARYSVDAYQDHVRVRYPVPEWGQRKRDVVDKPNGEEVLQLLLSFENHIVSPFLIGTKGKDSVGSP